MCAYEEFLISLYKYLLNKEDYNNNIIRRHSRNLSKIGELSFSDKLLKRVEDYRSFQYSEENITNLTTESKNWSLHILKLVEIEQNYHIFIEKLFTFKSVIERVLKEGNKYGAQMLHFKDNFNLQSEVNEEDLLNAPLTQLRIFLLKDTTGRLLEYNNYEQKSGGNIDIWFSSDVNKFKGRTIHCGPVLTFQEKQKLRITSQEFYK